MKTIPLKTLTDKTPGYPESEFDSGAGEVELEDADFTMEGDVR